MIAKTIVLYHADCMDGFAAAWAVWKEYGKHAHYHAMRYGAEVPDCTDADVIMVDFSLKRDEIVRLAQIAESVTILDHHKTAEAALKDIGIPNVMVHFDMEKSGAVITWDYFHGGGAPDWLAYIQDRDLWTWALPNSKEISAFLWSFPYLDSLIFKENVEGFSQLIHDQTPYSDYIVAQGKAILRYMDQQTNFICDRAFKINLTMPNRQTYNVPIANATTLMSEVGERLCERYTESPFSISWLLRKDKRYQYSLRSRQGFDVSEIAKFFKGGGHKAAAGFDLDYCLAHDADPA